MANSLIDADSLLAIDVGSITTRAALFDIVDGRYRYLASGAAPTTAQAPYGDVSEGIRGAIDQLQTVTGRRLIADDERLIMPSSADGSGVDQVAATISAGEALRVILVGLLEEVSLESVHRLASTSYLQVVETLGMNDRRKTEERIDLILRLRPDMLLVAGGTDGGASRSMLRLLESIGLADTLLPQENRPEILYAGNQNLLDEIRDSIGKYGSIQFADNIRPTLDVEQLDPAAHVLVDIVTRTRKKQFMGVKDLDAWAGGSLLPTATGFGRTIQYLSKIYDASKGVLGVDLGASALTVSAAFAGHLVNSVSPQFGMGLAQIDGMSVTLAEEVSQWLHLPVTRANIRNYLFNKSTYPASIPVTPEELAIEQALARVLMQHAWKKAASGLAARHLPYGSNLLPWFEPLIVSGSVITRAPNLAQSLLMVLDGLQPTGITTIGMDQNHLLPMLGAAAAINPLLAVQVLESNSLLNLGTVISPVGDARPGETALRLRVKYEGGSETSLEIKQGTLETVQLPTGQMAEVHIHPDHRLDVGLAMPGHSRRLRVMGGALGIIIDARGRPLRLPEDPNRRIDLISKWRWMLGC